MSDTQGFPTQRRGSIPPGTSPATSLFQRRGSLAVGIAPPPMFASPSASGDLGGPPNHHRRHMSVSASLGLATSPTAAFDFRRSSTSTSADSVGESSGSAIDDADDRPAPLQFARRLSVQPARGYGGGPVSAGAASPILDQGSYDWGAHLRARAQSSVSGARPVFGTSPPREPAAPQHRQSQPAAAAPRADPPVQPAKQQQPTPPKPARAKPDAYQERILKGDFYMD